MLTEFLTFRSGTRGKILTDSSASCAVLVHFVKGRCRGCWGSEVEVVALAECLDAAGDRPRTDDDRSLLDGRPLYSVDRPQQERRRSGPARRQSRPLVRGEYGQ